jgi:hypothetical protein
VPRAGWSPRSRCRSSRARATGRGALALEQRFRLGREPTLRGTYGPFLSWPVFLGGNRHGVVRVGVTEAGGPEERTAFAGFLTCDRIARSCARGRNLLPATTWAAVIDNPSRPE